MSSNDPSPKNQLMKPRSRWNERKQRRNGREKPRICFSAQMSKIGAQCWHSDLLNNSTISGSYQACDYTVIEPRTCSTSPSSSDKTCSFPMEIFTPQPRHTFCSSLWSLPSGTFLYHCCRPWLYSAWGTASLPAPKHCHHIIWSGQDVSVTIECSQARVEVSPWSVYMLQPGCGPLLFSYQSPLLLQILLTPFLCI